MHTLEPIDFCITLSSPSVEFMWRLYWGSLRRCCNLEGVRFHIINKDVDKVTLDRVIWSLRVVQSATIYDLPYLHYKNEPERNSEDVAYTCDYLMHNCGYQQWVCISHFDMWFKKEKDWLTFAREQIANDVAIIGNHCPIMLINREAYAWSNLKFFTSSHPRGDTGMALQREMVNLGWKVLSYPEFNDPKDEKDPNGAHSYFHHIGGGGTHYGQADINQKLELVTRVIQEEGY